MRKYFVVIAVMAFVTVFFSANVNAQGSVVGTWKTISDEGADKGKDKSHVEIFEKDGAFFGKVVKLLLKPQDTICTNCKDDLKDKPVVGMTILQNMKKTGKVDEDFGEEYAGGTIMDPENGKTFKCKLWVKGDTITLRGYISLAYRTQKWHRVK